jgi:hypothetical protein
VATFALARKVATLIYRMLRYGQDYVDIGEQACEAKFHACRVRNLELTAQSLAFKLTPIEIPAS